MRVREAKKGSGKMTGRADHGNSEKKKTTYLNEKETHQKFMSPFFSLILGLNVIHFLKCPNPKITLEFPKGYRPKVCAHNENYFTVAVVH